MENNLLLSLPRGKCLFIDTETGGFSVDRNPLLSVGLVVADENTLYESIEVKFVPPPNTLLEVPIPEHQLRTVTDKTTDYWLNLSTDERVAHDKDVKHPSCIYAGAAEVNYFVYASDTTPGWDFQGIVDWEKEAGGKGLTENLPRLLEFVQTHAVGLPVIAHYADFDKRFVSAQARQLADMLPSAWICTMKYYRQKYNFGKQGGSGLQALCKTAGYIPPITSRHTAIGDCISTHAVWKYLLSRDV